MNSTDKTARRLALLLSVYVLGGVTACGEVTFKRGAGPDAMQASEQSCRAKTSDVDAYAGCLRAAGYTYAKPSETGGLFVDEIDGPAADESAASLADTAGTETTPNQPPADAAALNNKTPTVRVEPSDRAGQSLPTSAKAKTMTVGMLRCLKDKGWFAVGR